MKEEFDHVLKNKIAELNQVPGVPYNKKKVWKIIYPRIRVRSSWNFFKIFTAGSVLISVVIILYMYWPKKMSEFQKDTIDVLPKAVLKKEKEIKTNRISTVDSVMEPINASEQITTNKTTTVPDMDTPSINTPKKVQVKMLKPKLDISIDDAIKPKSTTTSEYRKSVVHIYRPKRYIGSGLVFRLNGNDKLISRVKNNSHTMVYLDPGAMKFAIGKNELPLVLEPSEIYHLWISYEGFPIGKVVLRTVDKSFVDRNR
ncbi:hypothetical protein LV716_16510 [Flagellimonas sp. HMM57]|uniref:hypothetical protein n=1 Tax=unclassified Flagellimonas TaxID=2644544 RepID=UPI0013D69D26|nr:MULTISPECIES: hypothetical protein [unclassified Flagellimonas]UII75845.1 hypothetical protein LV716_16510 [Flagellimonas sp. HMM57]